MKLRIGTRRSRLATTQATQVCELLCDANPGLEYELVLVETTGDKIQDRPLSEAGGKGLFVKELDEALLDGRIDCAIHSLKDVPSVLLDGIVLAGIPRRADARDVLLSSQGWALSEVPAGAVVGTTSLRRAGQLMQSSPQASVRMLRGNVETRIRRIVDGDFDATFLAAAGLDRMGADVAPLAAVSLDPSSFVPAPGQGTLCITARSDAADIVAVAAAIDDDDTRHAAVAERALAEALGGSCYVPLGAYARVRQGNVELSGVVVSPDGTRSLKSSGSAAVGERAQLGRSVARQLLSDGAREVIAAAERAGTTA